MTTQTNFTLGDFDASVPHLQSHPLLYEVSSTTNSAAKQCNPSFHIFQGKALPFLVSVIAIGVQESVDAKNMETIYWTCGGVVNMVKNQRC